MDFEKTKITLLYILKCLIGLCLTYPLYRFYPQHQFFWSLISVLLVLSPEEGRANQLAYDRMKANVLGSLVGLAIFLLHSPNLIWLAVGVTAIIIIGFGFKLDNAIRSALATFVIVMVYEQRQNAWDIALERVGCVILGCLIGLGITLTFSFFTSRKV